MAEYLANALQTVALNQPAVFTASIPCTNGCILNENETGVFILRGNTSNCFARYQVIFSGNIALPAGATVVPISMGITVNGEVRPTSIGTVTPAAVQEYNEVTCTAIVTVPKGCCFNVSVRSVTPQTDTAIETPAPTTSLRNASLVITRIA